MGQGSWKGSDYSLRATGRCISIFSAGVLKKLIRNIAGHCSSTLYNYKNGPWLSKGKLSRIHLSKGASSPFTTAKSIEKGEALMKPQLGGSRSTKENTTNSSHLKELTLANSVDFKSMYVCVHVVLPTAVLCVQTCSAVYVNAFHLHYTATLVPILSWEKCMCCLADTCTRMKEWLPRLKHTYTLSIRMA